MGWPTVTTDDVVNAWRPLKETEETVAESRIKSVEAELRRELRLHGFTGTPDVGWATFETVDEVLEWETLYRSVIADVVAQSLKNPEGWLEESERIDDYTVTRRRDQATSTGLVFLTDADVEKLLPRPVKPHRGAFSIRLGAS